MQKSCNLLSTIAKMFASFGLIKSVNIPNLRCELWVLVHVYWCTSQKILKHYACVYFKHDIIPHRCCFFQETWTDVA